MSLTRPGWITWIGRANEIRLGRHGWALDLLASPITRGRCALLARLKSHKDRQQAQSTGVPAPLPQGGFACLVEDLMPSRDAGENIWRGAIELTMHLVEGETAPMMNPRLLGIARQRCINRVLSRFRIHSHLRPAPFALGSSASNRTSNRQEHG